MKIYFKVSNFIVEVNMQNMSAMICLLFMLNYTFHIMFKLIAAILIAMIVHDYNHVSVRLANGAAMKIIQLKKRTINLHHQFILSSNTSLVTYISHMHQNIIQKH